MKVGMLTTLDDQESLRSRPLQTLEVDAQGGLWFFVADDSPKVGEIDAHMQRIALAYADPHQQDYLSISGSARLSRDRDHMRRLWTPWAKVWFPQGLDDPRLALLHVEIEKAEYWAAPGSKVKRLFGLAKALTTGDKSAIGDNKKIDVKQSGQGLSP
jgi:general stress protein 26